MSKPLWQVFEEEAAKVSVEGQPVPRLFHAFKCDCGCWVRSESFEQLEKFANKHSRKCHLPSVQTTQTVPIDIPELSE